MFAHILDTFTTRTASCALVLLATSAAEAKMICQWCGGDSHKCEQINGSCGWLLAAATFWEELSRVWNGNRIIPFERAAKEYVRKAYAHAMRISSETHQDMIVVMAEMKTPIFRVPHVTPKFRLRHRPSRRPRTA